jgi:predicted O-methyltransferase YrrM
VCLPKRSLGENRRDTRHPIRSEFGRQRFDTECVSRDSHGPVIYERMEASHRLQRGLPPIQRVVRGSPGRKTRLHTMRGELPPPRALAELPFLAALRVAGREIEGPWLNAPSLRFLKRLVRPGWRVFEFGSGRSTTWYAKRVASVVALESARDWYQEVAAHLAPVDGARVELLPAREFPARLEKERDSFFDLIVVDGPGVDEHGSELPSELGRTGCVHASITKVRPGGVIMLDNSDLPRYRQVDSALTGWRKVRLSGFSTSPLTPTETTFYWRPAP